MRQTGFNWAIALLLAAQVGSATAQVIPQAGSGIPPAMASIMPGTRPADSGEPLPASSEPKSMLGMLVAQNDARHRMGVAPLAWSQDLTALADAAVRAEAKGSCMPGAVDRLTASANAGAYWAAATPRITGDGSAQNILPSYVVSQWRDGRTDYDISSHQCHGKDSACQAFSRMVSPAAKTVGCSKVVCASGAQIWVCQYSNE